MEDEQSDFEDNANDVSAAFDNPNQAQAPNIPPPNPGIQVAGNAPASPQSASALQPPAQSQPQQAPQLDFSKLQQPQQQDTGGLDFSNLEQPQSSQPPGALQKAGDDISDSVISGIGKLSAPFMAMAAQFAKGKEDYDNIRNGYVQELKDNPLFNTPEGQSMSPEDAFKAPLEAAGSATGFALSPFEAALKTLIDPIGKAAGVPDLGAQVGKAASTLASLALPVAGEEKAASMATPATDTSLDGNLALKPQPQMHEPIAPYENVNPSEMEQPKVASDEVASQYISAVKQLQQLMTHGEPKDAQGISQKQQLENTVNQLGPQIFGDQTEQAFRPVPDKGVRSYENIMDDLHNTETNGQQPESTGRLSQMLREQSSNTYNNLGNATFPDSFTSDFVQKVKAEHPEDPELDAALGKGPAQEYVSNLEDNLKTPMTLQRSKRIYEDLGNKATEHVLPDGKYDATGRAYVDLQSKLWSSVNDLTPTDIKGDPEEMQNWQNAKKDWQQSIKLSQIERMVDKSTGKAQPANSLRTSINNFVANPKNTLGWSPEEVNSLKEAGTMNTKDEVLRAVSSRLVPYVLGGISSGVGALVGGPLGAVAGEALGTAAGVPVSQAARAAAMSKAMTKVNTAKNTVLQNASDKGQGILSRMQDQGE